MNTNTATASRINLFLHFLQFHYLIFVLSILHHQNHHYYTNKTIPLVKAFNLLLPSKPVRVRVLLPTKKHKLRIKNHHHSHSFFMTKQSILNNEKVIYTNNEPIWCEEQQIYINGTIASSSHAEEHIQQILSSIQQNPNPNQHPKELHIFGYGSLCWNPGSTSNDDVLANPRVTKQIAKAIGWKRCWCQQSTDHRGDLNFYGLVCTLLHDDEIQLIHDLQRKRFYNDKNYAINYDSYDNGETDTDPNADTDKVDYSSMSMTEGVLYTIPSDLVELCLEQLDFREKGGYARDVIDVVIQQHHQQGSTSTELKYEKALLYRGTCGYNTSLCQLFSFLNICILFSHICMTMNP